MKMPGNKPPELDGHKVVCKGRRFWVIELEEGRTFDDRNKELADFAIYDTAEGYTIATASRRDGGGFTFWISFGKHELKYVAEQLEDIGRLADAKLQKIFRDEVQRTGGRKRST